jgi:ABC-type uncharacterized transport system permease subunit
MPITCAIAIYSIAWVILIRSTLRRVLPPKLAFNSLLVFGLMVHAIGLYHQISLISGYHFGFFKISSLFFWTAIFLVLLSSIQKPLHNLFLIILPVNIITLFCSLANTSDLGSIYLKLSASTLIHILLSILAYSTMIVATVQTLLLAFQNYQLRHKHPTGLIRLFPPLQTMEKLLFELLWAGELLLTFVIVTGIFQISSIQEQHLHHKIAFSVIAWLIYAVLLWGRHFLGWRGNSAIRWSLAGFTFLILAYLGSKLVLELILGIN